MLIKSSKNVLEEKRLDNREKFSSRVIFSSCFMKIIVIRVALIISLISLMPFFFLNSKEVRMPGFNQ